ncbi:MerR family transcriptional regulator [Pseudomonas sp. HK3]|jgi:DNA-binding transcriptional MerR regulator
MNIKQFSEAVDISAHTIRYYEKIGLLKNIRRNSSGHRSFTHKDIEWIHFVKRLKDTAMPLEIIHEYADFRAQGDTTNEHRMKILESHAKCLKDKIEQESGHLKRLEEKIEYYRRVLQENSCLT